MQNVKIISQKVERISNFLGNIAIFKESKRFLCHFHIIVKELATATLLVQGHADEYCVCIKKKSTLLAEVDKDVKSFLQSR